MFTLPKASIDKCGLLAPIDIHFCRFALGYIMHMVVVSLSARSTLAAAGGLWLCCAALEPLFEDGLLCALWPGARPTR